MSATATVEAIARRLAALTIDEGERRLAPILRRIGLMMAAAGLFAVAMAGALAALWIFLIPHIGPVLAPISIAGLALVMAGLLVLAASRIKAPPPPPDMMAGLSDAMRDNKAAVLIAALLAGFSAGSRPR